MIIWRRCLALPCLTLCCVALCCLVLFCNPPPLPALFCGSNRSHWFGKKYIESPQLGFLPSCILLFPHRTQFHQLNGGKPRLLRRERRRRRRIEPIADDAESLCLRNVMVVVVMRQSIGWNEKKASLSSRSFCFTRHLCRVANICEERSTKN